MATGPLESAAPTTPIIIGGVYNTPSPTPLPGQGLALQQDASGNVLVNIAAGAGTLVTPLVSGSRAALTYPVPVSDGAIVSVMADKAGRSVSVLNGPRDLIATASFQSTSATPATFISAGLAGIFNDIIELILTNESALATIVSLSDGTTTYKFALSGNGGGVFPFQTPLPATSAATAWQISNSAAMNVDCIAIYIRNK